MQRERKSERVGIFWKVFERLSQGNVPNLSEKKVKKHGTELVACLKILLRLQISCCGLCLPKIIVHNKKNAVFDIWSRI